MAAISGDTRGAAATNGSGGQWRFQALAETRWLGAGPRVFPQGHPQAEKLDDEDDLSGYKYHDPMAVALSMSSTRICCSRLKSSVNPSKVRNHQLPANHRTCQSGRCRFLFKDLARRYLLGMAFFHRRFHFGWT